MQTVDVLRGIDRRLDRELADVSRHRQLDDDPVDLGIAVQPADRREQLALGHVRGQVHLLRSHPDVGAGLVLRAEVDARGLVVTDEDRREPRLDAAVDERHHAVGDLGPDLRGDRLAVEDGRGHGRSSYPTALGSETRRDDPEWLLTGVLDLVPLAGVPAIARSTNRRVASTLDAPSSVAA